MFSIKSICKANKEDYLVSALYNQSHTNHIPIDKKLVTGKMFGIAQLRYKT